MLALATSTLTAVADIGQGIAALAAVGGLFFTGYQIRLGRQSRREEIASSYLARLNSRDFYNAMSKSREQLRSEDEQAREQVWQTFLAASLRRQQNYFLVMNLFEEVATLYNDGLVDDHAMRRLLGDTSRAYWREVRWFVLRYREEAPDPGAFREWQEMNLRLEQPPAPLGRGRRRKWPADGLFGEV